MPQIKAFKIWKDPNDLGLEMPIFSVHIQLSIKANKWYTLNFPNENYGQAV